jgi:Hint module
MSTVPGRSHSNPCSLNHGILQIRSPTICFSSQNTIEVEDVGLIPIELLCVGDMVKLSNDKYTQVYGFGHLDHQQEGTFLRISFYTLGSNHTLLGNNCTASFLQILTQHLVMIDKKKISYRIPFNDVVVGDILSGHQAQMIQCVVRHGVYAPLTQSVEIMVIGILTSNYADLFHGKLPSIVGWDQHIIAHTLFLPQRYFCSQYLTVCRNEIYIKGYGLLAYSIITWFKVIEMVHILTLSIIPENHLYPIMRFMTCYN